MNENAHNASKEKLSPEDREALVAVEQLSAYADMWKLEWPFLIMAGTVVVVAAAHLLWRVGTFTTYAAIFSGAAMAFSSYMRYQVMADKARHILGKFPQYRQSETSERWWV